MPGTFLASGADRCFKGGLVSGGGSFSLHSAAPPTDGNKISDSWYSDQAITEAQFTTRTLNGYRRMTTGITLQFGRVPSQAPAAPTHAALKVNNEYVWYDDVTFTGYAGDTILEVPAGDVDIEIQLAGANAPAE